MGNKDLIDSEIDYFKKISLIRKPILNFCCSRIFNKSDAADVAQNVFVILSKKKSTYNESKSFYGWAFSICRFQIMAFLSKNKRSKENASYDSICHSFFLSDELCPLNQALKSELKKERDLFMREKVQTLPRRQRYFMLHSLDGKSKSEIMYLMDISSMNYHAIKLRSIRSLKSILENESNK
ncbi:MAG: hypothetical protein CBC05_08540 [Crocinitomicaceae bacterium TMED45]|nr:MAG: hypothetical protein CBC05_08540 [Crocinitomicaceae bacterium TMED45]|tara:strand:- start:31340 stop:31885 length:546 start_codon:yes stop_codon:yes gene_type:complete